MVTLRDCITRLSDFKSQFGDKFGIIRLGIFGSVAREDNNENSDIDIVLEVETPSLTIMYELEQSLKDMHIPATGNADTCIWLCRYLRWPSQGYAL